MSQGSLKDLAKAHESKELEWIEDAQKNKMGQRSPNGTKEPESDEMGQ